MLPIICLMGPTASGKTQLALDLAERIPSEIISVDSALVYRGMDIGTAKPKPEILKRIPHHLIDMCDPLESYSGGRFCQDALKLIESIHQRHAIPILAGGTLLYFNLLRQGYNDIPHANLTIRAEVEQELKELGLSALHERLQIIDPQTAARIKPQDTQRIQRALELYYSTGKTMSELHAEQQKQALPYPVINFILMPPDRAHLHQQIAQRFQHMLDEGLIKEVEALYQRGDLTENLASIRTVGYRQVWEYLSGKTDYNLMREKAIAATRQLAKRQFTWLKKWDSKDYHSSEDKNLLDSLLKKIL